MTLPGAPALLCGAAAGESDPIKKNPEEDPWVRSGTQVRRVVLEYVLEYPWTCSRCLAVPAQAGLCEALRLRR